MDGNIDIYCEFGFLEKFCKANPQVNSISYEDQKIWLEYYELLRGHSDVMVTDIDKEKYTSYCDDSPSGQILEQILNSSYSGFGNFTCMSKEHDIMEISESDGNGTDYFRSKEQHIFLMGREKTVCKRMEEDYGLLFISMDNLNEYNLFSSDIQAINESSSLWECVKSYRLPCNTIVLVDMYMMKKDDDILKKWLGSLFDSLLPLKLNKTVFKISIFTKDDSDHTRNKRKKEIISKCIRSLRPYSIDIEISMRHLTKDHDRYLFTNYGLFNSGYGFALTDSELNKGTSLSFFPITHFSLDSKNNNNVYRIIQNLKERKIARRERKTAK